MSTLIVLTYILHCVRLLTRPWRYFQINSRYICTRSGVFSKLTIDSHIPEKWRLRQRVLVDGYLPDCYPVFLKPEWGENSKGVVRIDSEREFRANARRVRGAEVRYVVQDAAPGCREFEIFTTFCGEPGAAGSASEDVLTVTEVVNQSHRHPVNSVHNSATRYVDITTQFTDLQLAQLSGYKREIGDFGQSRACMRADSIQALLDGNFHIVEINLFTPMPINLLDISVHWTTKLAFINRVSRSLALATRAIDREQKSVPLFTRMWLYSHRRLLLGPLASINENTQKAALRRNHQKVHGRLQ